MLFAGSLSDIVQIGVILRSARSGWPEASSLACLGCLDAWLLRARDVAFRASRALPTLQAGRRGAVRMFAEFYQSDVIVASPLGLATALSAAAAEGGGAADFLSSVEVAVVDRADIMIMQNWAHVNTGARLLRNALLMALLPPYMSG